MSERSLGRRDFVKLAAGGALAAPTLGASAAAQPAGALPRPAKKKALFVYGGWDGHDPVGCRDLFVPWMRKTGFEVVVSDTQAPYADAALMNMVGGDWVAHPGGMIDYEVTITDHEDPVMAGLSDFKMKSEQYLMHVNPNNKVLATTRFSGAADSWIDGSTMPVVWKKVHGQGRVFYNSLGHAASTFDIPQALEIMQRGILWASESRYEATPDLVSPVYPLR